MKKVILLWLIISCVNFSFAQNKTKSTVLVKKVAGRYLTIYLPPNYSVAAKYKTVYFLDGNAIFNIKPDFEKLLNNLIKSKTITPIVLVGIHSTLSRTSDLVPYFDKKIIDYSGQYRPNAKLFSKFIQNEVIPYIDENFAVSKSNKDKALFGFSYGGLFTLWEISNNQNSWGMIASNSPSFWVKEYQIYKDIENFELKTNKIWFDIGTGEWNVIFPLIKILNKKGLKQGEDFFYYEVPKARHLYGDLLNRIKNPLIVFAGNQNYNPKKCKINVEFIKSYNTTKVYKRINPILILENGVKHSLSTSAKYEMLTKKDGIIYSDGSFEFLRQKPFKVKISFKNFEKIIKIPPQ